MRRALLVLLACVAAGVVALAQTPERAAPYGMRPLWPAPEAAPPRSAGDVAAGRAVAIGGEVHAGWACVQCHGLEGAAAGTGGIPRIAGQHAWYLYAQLQDYAHGARPHAVMTPIARTLTDSEMRDVAAWYAAQGNAPTAPPRETDLRVRQLGASINAVGIPARQVTACSTCHGTQGEGVAPAVPVLAGQHAPYTELQLLLWKRGERRNGPLGVMAQVAAGMTEAEIAAVAAYFGALPAAAATARAAR